MDKKKKSNKWWYIGGAIVVLIIIILIVTSGSSSKNGTSFTAVRQDIVQTVSVTGKVRSGSDVSLAFEKGGRVRSVNVEVGAQVYAGQILVSVENGDLVADLAQAQAKVKAEDAKLDELKKGSTSENIAVTERELESAKIEYTDARRTAVDTLQDAYTKADDVLFNKADQFFSNGNSSSPVFNFNTEFQVKINAQNSRVTVGGALAAWNKTLKTISAEGNLDAQFVAAKDSLVQLRNFLDVLALAINGLTSGSVSQSTIDNYKASLLTARTTIGAEISAVTTAEKTIRSTAAAVALQESKLALAKSPARPEQVRAQEAVVESVRASVLAVEAQVSKTILRSPIAGVITKRDVEPGEIVSSNEPLITVISTNLYKIEANIPESDVSSIKVGDKADVTLDAYNDARFVATILSIDPAETVIEGVATYRAVFAFAEQDARIKSGMTANIDVIVNEIKDAVTVPARTIIDKDGKKFVQVKSGNSTVEKEITVGAKDGEGNIEIKSGLEAGEVVITQ